MVKLVNNEDLENEAKGAYSLGLCGVRRNRMRIFKKRNWKRNVLLACTLFSVVPLSTYAQEPKSVDPNPTEEKVIYRNEMSTIKEEKTKDIPKTSVRIGNGMVYTAVNITEVSPELEVRLVEVPVQKMATEAEKDTLQLQVHTNYSAYQSRYELSFYSNQSMTDLTPLRVITGETLKNEQVITVDNLEDLKKNGDEVRYKLRVYDAENRYDETSMGIIAFPDRPLPYGAEERKREILDQSRITLRKRNITLNYGMVVVIGQNLIRVKTVEINGNQYTLDNSTSTFTAERLAPPGKYDVKVKTTFEDNTVQEDTLVVSIPDKYRLELGVADFTVGEYSGDQKNEKITIEKPNHYLYKTGRLSYFGQMRFNENTSGVFQFDTGEQKWDEIFDDTFRPKRYNVYERVQREGMYPVYGDDSIIYNQNDMVQQGKIFTEVKHKGSRALWGTYRVDFSVSELAQVHRTHYGALVEHKSEAATSFGESKISMAAYAAEAEVGHARNEFLGTGGSLYFLKNKDIIEDTEQLIIEVRDPESDLVKKQIVLYKGKDYKIDEYQGRITLMKPLSQYGGRDESIIRDNLERDWVQYLVVNYDYYRSSDDIIRNLSYGGQLQGWLGEYFSLGAAHIKENHEADTSYELNSVNGMFRYSDTSYLKGEYAKTRSMQHTDNVYSHNGGIDFESLRGIAKSKSGKAYKITGNIDLKDIAPKEFSTGNELSFWYREEDAGFSNGHFDQGEERKFFGTELRLRPNKRTRFFGAYHKNETKSELLNIPTEKKEAIVQTEYQLNDRVRLTGGLSDFKETSENKTKEATLFAGRIEYKKEGFSVYGIAQAALRKKNYDYDQVYTIGTSQEFFKNRVKLTSEYSITNNQDDRLRARIDVRANDRYSVYAGYELSELDSFNTNKFVVGNRYQFNDQTSFYTENQRLKERDSRANLQSYGMDYSYKSNHSINLSYQEGTVKERGQDYDRQAISLTSTYTKPLFRLMNKLEYRKDYGRTQDLDQYVTTNSIAYKTSPSFRIVGTFDYSITKDHRINQTVEKNAEYEIGWAYRPVTHNRFNWLGRYTYIENEGTLRAINSATNEKTHIFATEGNYKLDQRWSIGGKLGYKKEDYSYPIGTNRSVGISNEFIFYGVRVEYQVTRDWNLMMKYRYLQDLTNNDNKHGAVVGVYRSLGNHLKIGGGYNFSEINDDLRDRTEIDKGWFINVIGKF